MGYGILSGIPLFSSSIYCKLWKIYKCKHQRQIAVMDIDFEVFFYYDLYAPWGTEHHVALRE